MSLFSTKGICSREQRKRQLDWLATNTDVITSQSHSCFARSKGPFSMFSSDAFYLY
jgi:hypothetical protein